MVYPSPTGRARPQEATYPPIVTLHDLFPGGQSPRSGHTAPIAPFAVMSAGHVPGKAEHQCLPVRRGPDLQDPGLRSDLQGPHRRASLLKRSERIDEMAERDRRDVTESARGQGLRGEIRRRPPDSTDPGPPPLPAPALLQTLGVLGALFPHAVPHRLLNGWPGRMRTVIPFKEPLVRPHNRLP